MADPNRDALATHLRERGILYASATQPIRHRNGQPAPWAFYSWNATLTETGLRLAARCLLDRLKGFRSTQIATVGYTGMPLLSACVLLGEGRYTGLCIREQRKTYIACRRVEGPFDPRAPVVIIDDSISSGTSLRKAIDAIEDEGGEVEGAIALVQFPHRGGLDWANAAGYRAEAILDIWSDLKMAGSQRPRRAALPAGAVAAPEGLAPAALARFAAETWLATGRPPRPPRALDLPHDCAGGVFVSFREQGTETRLARDGFWHFDSTQADPRRDVIAATVEALRTAARPVAPADLARLKIAVTLFSALEAITLGDLDFRRYGIVARSRVFPGKVGGALPNTQVFISEMEQYRQARQANAGIVAGEPHDLFRHEVEKHVEAGASWLPYGVAEGTSTGWWCDAGLGERITARARGLLARAKSEPGDAAAASPITLPCRIEGVAVRLYRAGLVGYGIALAGDADGDLEALLADAAAQAAADPRAADRHDVAVVVSILHHAEPLGRAKIAHVAWKLRRGLDALEVRHASRTAVLLPSVLTYNSLSREDFTRTAARLAGVLFDAEAGAVEWRTLQCAEWVDQAGAVCPLRFGFPERSSAPDAGVLDLGSLVARLGGYVSGAIGGDGLPCYLLSPASGNVQSRGTAARAIHGLAALGMAGAFLDLPDWSAAAAAGLARCLDHTHDGAVRVPGWEGAVLADVVLLAAVADSPSLVSRPEAADLARRLAARLRPTGRIGGAVKRMDRSEDHDFTPGALLAALARFAETHPSVAPASFTPQIAWYAHRFAALPTWGSAGWLPQGMAAVHRLTGDPAAAALAFSATDWSLERQLKVNGAFLEDLSPDEPSFNTGFIAEGVAASLAIALAVGDTERAARYAASVESAARFMARLTILPEDVFAMRAGAAAVGGVRATLSSSDIRIDQVSHTLHALVTYADLQRRYGFASPAPRVA